MVIVDDIIYQTLSVICTTYQGFVREFQDLPCISFICTDNSTARKLDGVEYLTHLVYKVDLFCDDEDDYILFANKVNDEMEGIGFKREQMTYLHEKNTHLVFYYSGYVDENYYVYENI